MAGGAFWLPVDSGGGGVGTAPPADLRTATLVDEAAPNTLYVNGVQAVYDPVSDRTFYAWLGADRDLYAGQFDHTTGENTQALVAARPGAVSATDNHLAPSLVIAADGRLLIAWGTAASGANVQLSRSTSARDISAWSTTSLAPATVYPTLVVAPNGDVLMFHWPDGTSGAGFRRYSVRRSTDHGATWGSLTDIVDTDGVGANPIAYVFPVTLGPDDLVHLTWTVGNSVTASRTNIYHATYDPASGTMRNLAGDDLGATVTSAEHASCQVFAGANVHSIRHTITADRIYVVFHLGTDGTSPVGDYTVRVSTWNGTAWSTADTGAEVEWRWSQHHVIPYKDGLLGLFCEWNGDTADVTAWTSSDGATWYRQGVVLPASHGEGYIGVLIPAGDGPFLALADQINTGFSLDPADGLGPITAVLWDRAEPAHDHNGDYEPAGTVATHNTDASAHANLTVPAASVRDAGRWEVVVTGTAPPVAVTTEDETDWLYDWVED